MTIPGAPVYTQGTGTSSLDVAFPIYLSSAPSSSFGVTFPIGKRAIVQSTNSEYVLTSISTVAGVTTATWTISGSPTGDVSTLTGSTGTATPAAGNIKLAGTANQVTTAASGSTVTFTLPAAITAPGSLTTTTSLTATLGNITATNGNLVLGTLGNKLVIPAGANGSVGVTGMMTGTPGAISVASTAITAASVILYSRATTGGTPGEVSITAQSSGNFTLTSTGNETSTFNYVIIN